MMQTPFSWKKIKPAISLKQGSKLPSHSVLKHLISQYNLPHDLLMADLVHIFDGFLKGVLLLTLKRNIDILLFPTIVSIFQYLYYLFFVIIFSFLKSISSES